MPRKKLTPQQAKALLIADGVDFSQDFHSQDRYVVGRLEELARAAGYRKSKNAPGSTVRMFYQYLSRVAPVVHAPGQLTPAERRAYQARARGHVSTKKSPAQLQREIDEALQKPKGPRAEQVAHATRKTDRSKTGLPVRDDVTEVKYHRPPTASEIRFGHGATHYRTFPVEEAVFPGTRVLKKWIVASDDGLRYYR